MQNDMAKTYYWITAFLEVEKSDLVPDQWVEGLKAVGNYFENEYSALEALVRIKKVLNEGKKKNTLGED